MHGLFPVLSFRCNWSAFFLQIGKRKKQQKMNNFFHGF